MNRHHLLLAAGALLLAGPAMAADSDAQQTRGFYLQLIHQARADGRPRAAIAYLDDFDRQFPGDINARILRVNSLIDLGQIDQADQTLTLLAHIKNVAAVDAVRGHVAAARGQWAAAATFYQTAVTGSPTDPLLRNALGYALLRIGRCDAAIEQLHAAGDLAPTDTVIRNNLLLGYAMAGRKADLIAAAAQIDDRRARTELLHQISTEAGRLGAAPLSKKANG